MTLACLALALPLTPIDLRVDASQVTTGVISVRETIPVSSRAVAIYLPKWIPGEHGPFGIIQSVAHLHFFAGKSELQWRRDRVEMFRFLVQNPSNAPSIEAHFISLSTPGDAATDATFRAAMTSSSGALNLVIGEGPGARQVQVVCPGGPLIPHLKRGTGPDYLASIAAPRSK